MANESTSLKTAAGDTTAEQTRSGIFYRPNVDILERRDELLVVADIPGASGEDVEIRFEEGDLTIHARVRPRHDGVHYLLQEYGVGDYWRTFQISEAVDASKIEAEFSDGVLTLHLPKAETLKPRKIEVRKT